MSTPPLIAVATHHGSIAELLADAEFRSLANRDGFLIELRLDYFEDLCEATLAQALEVFAPNVLATYRCLEEGGKRQNVSDSERIHYLQLCADRGVKFIDIEARTPREGFDLRGAKLISSFHNFDRTPDDLESIWNSMAQQRDVDFIKIAVMPQTVFDTRPLLEILRKHGPRSILLAMGESGLWTRILAGRYGSPLTYARGESAPGTAPGQLTWRQLDELYRFREIGADWQVYGVIGNPVGQSLSPLIHNAALKQRSLSAVYLPFKVELRPAEFVKKFEPLGLRGLSVTIPHKEAVLPACDSLDPLAEKIGAVNTLVWDANFSIRGYNTDAEAAADSLQSALGPMAGKNVAVLGAGGAGRAVAFGVKSRGANVFICNRTPEKAQALLRDVGATVTGFDTLAQQKIDAIVNTTSLGMSPNVAESPLTESQIPPGCVVFDTVYNPRRTRLLELAQARGCRIVEGVEMFIAQGARQFELWTGQKAPVELMRQAVLAQLK